ncbi:MAG: putative phage tail protein [Lysinibacillus sp.]
MKSIEEMKFELKRELPQFYDGIRDFREILNANANNLTAIDNNMDAVLDQLFLETATWGLARWEKIFGITPDESKPLEQRRSLVKSKIRGAGVTTTQLVKEVAESWYNGEIDVIEGLGIIGIKFKSRLGVPPNLKDLEKALREIMPAHLVIEYLFTFLVWNMIDAANKTWGEIDALSMTWDEFETWTP